MDKWLGENRLWLFGNTLPLLPRRSVLLIKLRKKMICPSSGQGPVYIKPQSSAVGKVCVNSFPPLF